MNITINIDDMQMDRLIKDGINALDDETVKNIAKQSLCKAFENPEMAKQILFEKQSSIYGGPDLQKWVKDAISRSLTTADYEKFKDIVFKIIGEHARDIIVETLAKTLADNMFSYSQQSNFAEKIFQAIREGRN